MFIDEPEGTLEKLPEYLGSASAVGNAISLWLNDGNIVKAFLDYSQELYPKSLKLFKRDERDVSEYFSMPTSKITHFKLHRYGFTQSTIDDEGVPISVPGVIVRSKKVGGSAKIICPGTVSIQADEIEGGFEILDKE